MAGSCGGCDGCCRVLEVKEIGKAFHAPCRFLTRTVLGPGCGIYESRPEPCKTYVCLWLDSQRRANTAPMPYRMRPDQSRVVMGNPAAAEDPRTLMVYPYPGYPDAWREGAIGEHLRLILSRGGTVVVVLADRRITLRGDMAMVLEDAEAERP